MHPFFGRCLYCFFFLHFDDFGIHQSSECYAPCKTHSWLKWPFPYKVDQTMIPVRLLSTLLLSFVKFSCDLVFNDVCRGSWSKYDRKSFWKPISLTYVGGHRFGHRFGHVLLLNPVIVWCHFRCHVYVFGCHRGRQQWLLVFSCVVLCYVCNTALSGTCFERPSEYWCFLNRIKWFGRLRHSIL